MRRLMSLSAFLLYGACMQGAEEEVLPISPLIKNPYFQMHHTLQHEVGIVALAVNKKAIAFADKNQTVGCFMPSGNEYTKNILFQANGSVPEKLLFWQDSHLMTSDGTKAGIRLTDIETGTFSVIKRALKVTAFAVHENALFLGNNRGGITIFDLKTQKIIKSLALPQYEPVIDIIPLTLERCLALTDKLLYRCNITEGHIEIATDLNQLTGVVASVHHNKMFMIADGTTLCEADISVHSNTLKYIETNKDWSINLLSVGNEILFSAEHEIKRSEDGSEKEGELGEVVQNAIKLFDVGTGAYIDTLPVSKKPSVMTFYHNTLYTADEDGEISFWVPKLLSMTTEHTYPINNNKVHKAINKDTGQS